MYDISPEVPTALTGDPLRLGQSLSNLCSNAVKFTDPGDEIVVRVSMAREIDDNNVELQFSVQDSGIGMSREVQNNLFQPFSQADTSITRKYGGTGLGLVITRQLIEMMGGKIWVESKPDVGSTFYLTVRLGRQANAPGECRFEELRSVSLNVLVVDDSDASRDILTSQLGSFGLKVDQEKSGEAALKRLKQMDKESPYDLVLMDWQMPGLDGIETARLIQSKTEIDHIPMIIMVSAYGSLQLKQAVRNLDLAGFLTKPVLPSKLYNAVLKALGYEAVKPESTCLNREEVEEAINKLRGAKVLLVEDDAINQELAMELLINNGMKMDCAVNGQQALEFLDRNRYDGVLMDCQMPVMDGYCGRRKDTAES